MTDAVRYAWAPITKREKQPDGSLIVHGPAADPSLDRDGQRLDPGWLAEAFPAWYAESGNIREQHDPKRAVGRAVGYAPDGDVHNIAARLVDPVAVAKTEAEVLQGFSVGIKNPVIAFSDPSAPNGTIVGGQIIEVSVVDRPANPHARFALAKADSAGDLAVVEGPFEEATVSPEQQALLEHWAKVKADAALVTGHGVDTQVSYVSGAGDSPASPDFDAQQSAQIDDAKDAIAAIARLIQGEAEQLAQGSLDETNDISTLLGAANALAYFIACETDQMGKTDTTGETVTDTTTAADTTPAADVTADKTDEATTTATDPEQDSDQTKTDTPDLIKAQGAAVVELLLKSEQFTTLTTSVQTLTERLAKIEAAPVPGGPVLTRTAADTAQANKSDSDRLRREASELLEKAERAEDRYLAQGYQERAKLLLAQAG